MADKHNDDRTGIDELNDRLTNAGKVMIEKKRIIFWIVGIALLIGVFVLSYLFIYKNPRTNKSFEAYNQVEMAAQGNDSIATAMYQKVMKEHSGTPGGNLAALNAGELLYDQGKYQAALDCLKEFSSSDPVMQANAYALAADCYVNLKKYDQALDYLDKAISADKKNPEIVPRMLLKKANIYDEQKKYDKALKCYEEIRDDYPAADFGPGIDAYIEREKARLGK